jgi:hypothetical protein
LLAAVFEDKTKTAQQAGVELREIDAEARRIVESSIAKVFEVSADVIARRMTKDRLWG